MSPIQKNIRILIAGGGTGGHLFPGMSIAEEFMEKRNCDVRFVGTVRGIESKIIPKNGYQLYTLPISGLYRVGWKKKLKTLLKLPFALIKSFWILITFRPQLVIGIGGYASGPILALAILLRMRTLLQEQNAYPGMTNRILGRYVPLSFVPFSGLEKIFKNPMLVGNPIRKAIKLAAQQPSRRNNDDFVITIIGGSQGARILNKTIIALLPQLSNSDQKFKIIHQTGQLDFDWVLAEYQKFLEIDVTVKKFFEEMEQVYQQTHLLICRAGSMVNEIIAMGRASILVPIPNSSGNHQRENAKQMQNAGAAIMIEESQLSAESLYSSILRLMQSPDETALMEKKSKGLYQGDSATEIVNKSLEFYRL